MAEADTQSVARNPYPFRAATEDERDRRRRLSRSVLGSPISVRNLQPLRINAATKLASRQLDRADQEAMRSRQLRQNRINELRGRARLKARGQDMGLAQLEKLKKSVRQVRAVITIVGGLTSLTIIGIIWTVLQWNIQLIITGFAPEQVKDWFGLPMPGIMIPVVLLIDVIVFVLICSILMLVYFAGNPKEAICTIGPDTVKQFTANGFLSLLVSLFGKIAC